MSVHVMSWVLRNSEERLGNRLVLLVLADHASDDGTHAFPKINTIASEARLSRSQVIRCLQSLVASGAIEKIGERKSGTNEYRVLMPEGSQYATGGVASTTTEGSHPAAVEVARRDPNHQEPSVEIEPSMNGAQTLVAGYVDHARELGVDPPRRLIGQVAKLVGELLSEGQDPETVAKALRIMLDRRLNPSTLPSLIPEARAGPAKRQSDLDADFDRLRELQFRRGGL